MTQPNPQPLAFIGVKMSPALAQAVKATAQQRGQTVSALVRAAVARDLASVPNPQKAQ